MWSYNTEGSPQTKGGTHCTPRMQYISRDNWKNRCNEGDNAWGCEVISTMWMIILEKCILGSSLKMYAHWLRNTMYIKLFWTFSICWNCIGPRPTDLQAKAMAIAINTEVRAAYAARFGFSSPKRLPILWKVELKYWIQLSVKKRAVWPTGQM